LHFLIEMMWLPSCCARAERGHVANAPPTRLRKSRLLIRSPRQREQATSVAHSTQGPLRS
jgi:hypothetical protein